MNSRISWSLFFSELCIFGSPVLLSFKRQAYIPCIISQADHPLLVGAVVDWNLSNDPLLFIEEIHMNNTVAVICSKMQNSKQIFQ